MGRGQSYAAGHRSSTGHGWSFEARDPWSPVVKGWYQTGGVHPTNHVGCPFIKSHNILHPLNGVSTVIHELAHIYMEKCNHKHKGSESHFVPWETATKFLAVIFRVSKIWQWMFFFWFHLSSNINICKWIYTTYTTVCIFHFQCQPFDEWPLLQELHVELGDGWICRMVHGITICCGRCTAYLSTTAQEKLAGQKNRARHGVRLGSWYPHPVPGSTTWEKVEDWRRQLRKWRHDEEGRNPIPKRKK